jgi:hypothetical protein
MSPAEILAFHDAQIKAVAKGRGKGNSLRKDSATLVAAVFSFPVKPEAKSTAGYIALRDDSLQFFKQEIEERGGTILDAIQHDDESYLHVHVFAMNLQDKKLSAKKLHRGHIAADAAPTPTKAARIKAYASAMREFQTDYSAVTAPHGLTRRGPRVQRLSHAEWMAQKSEAARQAERYKALDIAEQEATVAMAKAVEAEIEARAAAARHNAFAQGVVAWCDGELDNQAMPVAHLDIQKKFRLLAAIQPAKKLLTLFIKTIAKEIARFTDPEVLQYKSNLKPKADEIAQEWTDDDRMR